jgi:hypothetical protein
MQIDLVVADQVQMLVWLGTIRCQRNLQSESHSLGYILLKARGSAYQLSAFAGNRGKV